MTVSDQHYLPYGEDPDASRQSFDIAEPYQHYDERTVFIDGGNADLARDLQDAPKLAQYTPSKPYRYDRQNRMCGLRRKTFFLLLAISGVIVLAAIIAAVLDAVLSKKHDKPRQYPTAFTAAKDKTTLALMHPLGSSTLYSYHMDEQNGIVETTLIDTALLQNGTTHRISNITSDAAPNSPIAAAYYSIGSDNYRQVFYIGNDSLVKAINSSGDTWNAPYSILPSAKAQSGSPALAVCQGQALGGEIGVLDGMRVYYGSSEGDVQELGYDFNSSVWTASETFKGSDVMSGVACAYWNAQTHLYLRNSSASGVLQQWTYDYSNSNKSWALGSAGTAEVAVAEHGNMAVATDSISADYVFYQDVSRNNVMAYTRGDGLVQSNNNITVINTLPADYFLAANWYSDIPSGAIVLSQNSSEPTELLFTFTNQNRVILRADLDTNNTDTTVTTS